MPDAKIVIYMSCYNHQEYVKEAMDSIIGQTYTNWELYVVNDGSTDKTGEIIATYDDKRIHFFNFKTNTSFVGAAKFLQKILFNVKADYIATMSSDDKWELEKLEKQVKLLTEHPEYKACFTWDKVIFEENGGSSYLGRETYSHKENMSRYDWINFFFNHGNRINACSMLMDKAVFYELGGMNEYYIQLGDWRLWFKLAIKYPFYLLNEELTHYRRHGSNLSESKTDVFLRTINEGCQLVKEIVESIPSRVFDRAFYRHLPYVLDGSEEELLAAKFILLADAGTAIFQQTAINIFFEHCNNEAFINVLENKYFFKAQDFFDLTGSGGMQYSWLSIPEIQLPARTQINICSPGEIIVNHIDSNKIHDTFPLLRYSTLCSLYDFTRQYEDGKHQFQLIKEVLENIRSQIFSHKKGRKRILIFIAEDSNWDITSHLDNLYIDSSKAEFIVTYVSPKRTYFTHPQEHSVNKKEMPEKIRQINLYDHKEHCLRFPDELNEEIDIIWYIDCLGNDFECEEMIAGYSLKIEQNCILNKTLYDAILQENIKSLHLMNKLQIYERGY